MGSLSNRSNMKSFVCVCLFAAASAAPAADADADPALLYNAFPSTYNYGVVPAVHSSVVKSVVSTPAKVEVKSVSSPVVYNAVHTPVVHTPVVHSPVVYNTAAVHAPVVATAPVVAKAASYYANSGGAVHIAKRDADADADAAPYYGVYGYAPYASYAHVSPYAYTYGAYRPFGYASYYG